jgi:pyrroloquinoline-quinone synthase
MTAAPALDPRAFLRQLRAEVSAHAGVGHSLLGRMAIDPRAREDFKILSGQHYALVGCFTRYLEVLLLRAPNPEARLWLAKVLVDEYGERSSAQDHATLYRSFMLACGWRDEEIEQVALHPAVTGFVTGHLKLCAEAPFLVGLGAVGPGHEWAIPAMFAEILRGLDQAAFAPDEIAYFTLHTVQDQDHGAWLEEALAQFATDDTAQEQIREGCRFSLAARERLWWGIADKLNAGRMRARFPAIASATAGSDASEPTLAQFRAGLTPHITFPVLGGRVLGGRQDGLRPAGSGHGLEVCP